MNFVDRAGQRYGKLTVIKRTDPQVGAKYIQWHCRCDCGNDHLVRSGALNNGNAISCGCIRKKNARRMCVNNRRYAQRTIQQEYRYHCHAAAKRQSSPLELEDWKTIVFSPCLYCGHTDIRGKSHDPKRKSHYSNEELNQYLVSMNGVDRIDSSRGYEKSNCAPCCGTCNFMKSDMTQLDFILFVRKLYNYLNGTPILVNYFPTELSSYQKTTVRNAYRLHKKALKNKNKEIEFLNYQDWEKIVFQPCHYCGSIDVRNTINYVTPNKASLSSVQMNGIDRIDSSEDYRLSNCVPCCRTCNWTKNDLPIQLFVAQVSEIFSHTSSYI